jgi:hypothetical protein
MDYPITGCGLPACRTCHPYLIPDEPPALTLRQVAGAIVRGALAFCAMYVLLVLFLGLAY